MEVKTGKELLEEIKAMRDEEEIHDLAIDDPDAILLHDKDESIINSDYAEVIDNAYDDAADYLNSKLKDSGDSLDKLADELGYDTRWEFLDDLLTGKDGMTDALIDNYNGERLGDIYDDAR